MKEYSLKYRKKVLDAIANGELLPSEAARKFNVSLTTVLRWKKRITPFKRGTGQGKATRYTKEVLAEDIRQFPYDTFAQRGRRLGCGGNNISFRMKKYGFVSKVEKVKEVTIKEKVKWESE